MEKVPIVLYIFAALVAVAIVIFVYWKRCRRLTLVKTTVARMRPSQTRSVLLFKNNLALKRSLVFDVGRMSVLRLGFSPINLKVIPVSVVKRVIRLGNNHQDTGQFRGSTEERLLPVVQMPLRDHLLRAWRAATFSCEFEPKWTARSDVPEQIADCIRNHIPGPLELTEVIFRIHNGTKLRMTVICRNSQTLGEVVFNALFKLMDMDSRSEGVTALLPRQGSWVVPRWLLTYGTIEDKVNFSGLLTPRDIQSKRSEYRSSSPQGDTLQDISKTHIGCESINGKSRGFLYPLDADVPTEQKSHKLTVNLKGLHAPGDDTNFSETSPVSALVGFNTDTCNVHGKVQAAVLGVNEENSQVFCNIKNAWLRAVPLMLHFLQNACACESVPINSLQGEYGFSVVVNCQASCKDKANCSERSYVTGCNNPRAVTCYSHAPLEIKFQGLERAPHETDDSDATAQISRDFRKPSDVASTRHKPPESKVYPEKLNACDEEGKDLSDPSTISGLGELERDTCDIDGKLQAVIKPDDGISLGVHNFKEAWFRAVTLTLQFLQNSCVSREAPIVCPQRKSKVAIHCPENDVSVSQKSIDKKRFINKSTAYCSQPKRDHTLSDINQVQKVKCFTDDAFVMNRPQDCRKSTDDLPARCVKVQETRKRCCCQDVLPGAMQVLHAVAGQSDLSNLQHHQQSKGADSNKDDYNEEAEEYENELVLDSLEIEDEDQLDMILQDGQDDLQNTNNDLIGNEVPVADWLPGLGQGYQAFPVPHVEFPEGHGAPHNLLNDVPMEQQVLEGEDNAGQNDDVGHNVLQGPHVLNGIVIVPWMQAQSGNQVQDDEVPLGQEAVQRLHNQNAALIVYEIPVNAQQAQAGHQEDAGPQDEIPQHFHIQQQQFEDFPNVHENGTQNDVPVMPDVHNADEEHAAHGAGAPSPSPPLPPLPPNEEHPPQAVQASGPLDRLRAAARYVKVRLTWNRHGNTHHGNPLYVPGAPREERAPLGLEEAPPLPGGHLIQNEGQRTGCFPACFGLLFRCRRGAAVQVYPQQGEQAPEFEEAAAMAHVVDEEIEEEKEEADEEPLEAVEEIPPQNIVLIF